MESPPAFAKARAEFHAALLGGALTTDEHGVPSNADGDSTVSVAIATGIVKRLGQETRAVRAPGQTSGRKFEVVCHAFIEETFRQLGHLRPGQWQIRRGAAAIAQFEQYAHLAILKEIAKRDPEVATALGSDYLIKPDVVVSRSPEADETINATKNLVSDAVARHTSLRLKNNALPILHASISCKWSIRSDRAQNARSEGLNLVKNRKGKLPHVVVITAEPAPNRIASIALGTGEIDCVYHFALAELEATLADLKYEDARELVATMVQGKRLKDIADLPLDLAV